MAIEAKVREKLMMWEDKEESRALLSNLQKDSYIALTTPLDADWPEDMPLYDNFLEDRLDTTTPAIKTSQQFAEWYGAMERQNEEARDGDTTALMGVIEGVVGRCEDMQGGVEECLELLTLLKTDYIRVATKTNSLHEACEMMLEEQSKCLQAAESLTFRLKHFQQYNSIYKKISTYTYGMPPDTILATLTQINDCLSFINKQDTYREAEVYKDLFKQCLNKVLVCLRDHVFSVIRTTAAPAPVHQMSHEDLFLHLHSRFRTFASKLKPFIHKLEQNEAFDSEYADCLAEVHRGYLRERSKLLHPSIHHSFQSLSTKHHIDYSSLLQDSCFLLMHLCEDEHTLFHQFFSLPTPSLQSLLEAMCTPLYDLYRPHIIHIKHVETLAQICRTLKEALDHQTPNEDSLRAFRSTCTQLQQDVQERLVFVTHIFIHKQVTNYLPSPGDVTFTERLQLIKQLSDTCKNNSTDAAPASDICFPNMWYPTIRRTLNTMSKLFQCLDKETFEELCQDLISGCVHSLLVAKLQVPVLNSDINAEMFLIKHLLILREQIVPFHIDSVIKETVLDLHTVTNTAKGLFKSPSLMFALNNNNIFLQLLLEGAPGFTEKQIDGKKLIDETLKKSCEQFIHTSSTLLLSPLHLFIKKYTAVRDTSEDNVMTVKMQPFASIDALHDILVENRKAIKTNKIAVKDTLSLYLSNQETEHILWKPVQSNVLQVYHQLHQLLEDYTQEERAVIAAPSIEAVKLLLSS